MIEKFENVEEMEKSYQNLEKEFTKKCQELAGLKKELLSLKEQEAEENNVPAEPVVALVEEQAEPEKVEEPIKNASEFGLDFRAKAGEFLRQNEDAKAYSKEISKILLKDKSLLNCSDPFMVAYAMVLKNEAKNKPKMEEVPVSKKIESVMEDIKPTVPLISKEMVGLAPVKTKPKFKTLEDAREELLNRYFG